MCARTSLYDRRTELVLSFERSELRRRASCDDELYREGGEERSAGSAAETTSFPLGRFSARATGRLVGCLSGVTLDFNNDIELLRSEVAAKFPKQIDRFNRLLTNLLEYDDLKQEDFDISTRKVLNETLDDPLLIEMILCPLMWYGNAREHDMDWGQFCIMFRSIFLEGFARPFRGVRLILKNLVRRFRELGGQLMLRSGVERIEVDGDHCVGVTLENGRKLTAKRILSSAGVVETLRMCSDTSSVEAERVGQMTFIETISVLDCQPRDVGFDKTIVFFNDSPTFDWEPPKDDLCDIRTGVLCSPNNYLYSTDEGELEAGFIRQTTIAHFDRWKALSERDYLREKMRWYDAGQPRRCDLSLTFGGMLSMSMSSHRRPFDDSRRTTTGLFTGHHVSDSTEPHT